MKKTAIKSFTLFEIVLAMMLSGIVIGMAYTAFTLFTKIYGSYYHNATSHSELMVFRKMARDDFMEKSVITLSDSLVIIGDFPDSSQIRYMLTRDLLVRHKNNAVDTFKLKNLTCNASFEGNEISKGIVDLVVLRFQYRGSPIVISLRKEYAAKELFNYSDSLWNR